METLQNKKSGIDYIPYYTQSSYERPVCIYTKNEYILNHKEELLNTYGYDCSNRDFNTVKSGILGIVPGFKNIQRDGYIEIEEHTEGVFILLNFITEQPEQPVEDKSKKFFTEVLFKDIIELYPDIKEDLQDFKNFVFNSVTTSSDGWMDMESAIYLKMQEYENSNALSIKPVNVLVSINPKYFAKHIMEYAKSAGILDEIEAKLCDNINYKSRFKECKLLDSKEDKSSQCLTSDNIFKKIRNNVLYNHCINNNLAKSIIVEDIYKYLNDEDKCNAFDDSLKIVFTHDIAEVVIGNSLRHEVDSITQTIIDIISRTTKENIYKILKEDFNLNDNFLQSYSEIVENNITNLSKELHYRSFDNFLLIHYKGIPLAAYNLCKNTLFLFSTSNISIENSKVNTAELFSDMINPSYGLDFKIDKLLDIDLLNILVEYKNDNFVVSKEKAEKYINNIVNSDGFEFLNSIIDYIFKQVAIYKDLYNTEQSNKSKIREWVLSNKPNTASAEDTYADNSKEESVNERLHKILSSEKISIDRHGLIGNSIINSLIQKMFDTDDFYRHMLINELKKADLINYKNKLLSMVAEVDNDIKTQEDLKKYMLSKPAVNKDIDVIEFAKETITKDIDSYANDLENIINNPRVINIHMDSKVKSIHIDVKDVNVKDYRTDLIYDLGTIRISIPFSFEDPSYMRSAHPSKIKFRSIHSNGTISGIGEYTRASVVHGNGERVGFACLGDATNLLSRTMKNGDLLGTFIVALRYCESANTKDSRGKTVNEYLLKKDMYSMFENILPIYALEYNNQNVYNGDSNILPINTHNITQGRIKDINPSNIEEDMIKAVNKYNDSHELKLKFISKDFTQDILSEFFNKKFTRVSNDILINSKLDDEIKDGTLSEVLKQLNVDLSKVCIPCKLINNRLSYASRSLIFDICEDIKIIYYISDKSYYFGNNKIKINQDIFINCIKNNIYISEEAVLDGDYIEKKIKEFFKIS